MKVVSNASPVIIFARAGLLTLIEGLFGEILVSEEVYQEMIVPTKPGVEAIRKAKSIKKLEVKDPNRFLASKACGVSTADTTVIALAKEQGAALVLIDDKRLRRLARETGLPVVGSGGILLKAKEEGLITEVKSTLNLLIKHGARIGEPLYRRILTLAGEKIENGSPAWPESRSRLGGPC
jgi:predicted nucleic acid-binding protein